MIDIHVHFFPPAAFRAIWRFFEVQSKGLWPIRYKHHTAAHIECLAQYGVERFTTLVYAHKPGMAGGLNRFVAEWAAREPRIIPFGTIYAGDGDRVLEARRIFEDDDFYGIKLHPFVSNEELDDEKFFPVYEMMEALGKVVVCHPASAPNYHSQAGAGRLRTVLERFPKLKVVIAHCGAYEYDEYPRLADDFSEVYFDTAMNCIHHSTWHNNCPGPAFFQKYQDRVLYGSDYPNIPYAYPEQQSALKALGLGPVIEQKIFRGNAERLLGLAG